MEIKKNIDRDNAKTPPVMDKIKPLIQKSLRFIKNKWLELWVPFFIKAKKQKPLVKNKNTQKVAVLIDVGQKEVIKDFQNFFSESKLSHQLFFLVLDNEKKDPYSQNTFSMDDITWNGVFNKKLNSRFFDQTYDVLINYYQKPSSLLALAAYRCKNNVSIGFANNKSVYADLIFNFKMDLDLLKKELPKYLNIIKE